jgi:hypothetical protein
MRWLDRRTLFTALTLAVVLGTPEILVRLLWRGGSQPSRQVGTRPFVTWLSELSLGREAGDALYARDRDLLWVLRPGVRFEAPIRHRLRAGEEQRMRITINDEGYRGPPAGPSRSSPGEIRVLCLGDSNFFGYPLDDAHAFPAALEAALERDAGDPATVINAGVPGYGVLQGSRWYEEKFAGHEIDWLLLSFLNNDAWLQPTPDRVLLARGAPAWIGDVAEHVRFVQWARAALVPPPPREEWVPRVSLDEFEEAYRGLIREARARGARALILDHRAHPGYEPYSERLREVARSEGALYRAVAEEVAAAFADPSTSSRYPDLARRVQRRWTDAGLEHRPHLRYYAEVQPEHLNEVGVAWLADVVSRIVLAAGPGAGARGARR